MAFTKWVRICEEGEAEWKKYLESLDEMRVEEMLKEFFTYLDYTEWRGEGGDIEVHPISISCGRVMMTEPLGEVLKRLREFSRGA